jgi:hypothetical protein
MKSYSMLAVTALSLIGQAHSQAFCALRDPARHIRSVHGSPIETRSMVATIDNDIRRAVAQRLPFTLHARELGRHTLYLLTDDNQPVGYVHARSEASPWGMVEVIWSLDEELRVQEFRFQRCRSPKRESFESKEFRSWIRGRGFEELRTVMDQNAESIKAKYADMFQGREDLAVTIFRSALKAILVTELAWGNHIAQRRMKAMLANDFGATSFEVANDGNDIRVLVGRNAKSEEVGRVVRLPETVQGLTSGLFYLFSPNRNLQRIWRLPTGPQTHQLPAQPLGESQPNSPSAQLRRALKSAFTDK